MSSGGWVLDDLYTRLSYTYVNAEESLPGVPDRQLRSRPEHTAQVELRYRFPRDFMASFDGIYVDKLYDLDDDDVYTELDNYFVLNAKVSRAFGERLVGYLAVSNLSDDDYQQRLGDPRPGRAVRLGVTFEL